MTCEEDLAIVNRWIGVHRLTLTVTQQQLGMVRGWVAALDVAQEGSTATTPVAAVAADSAMPGGRETAAVAQEQRATDGEEAQVAALLREIADMEARLDRLEAR